MAVVIVSDHTVSVGVHAPPQRRPSARSTTTSSIAFVSIVARPPAATMRCISPPSNSGTHAPRYPSPAPPRGLHSVAVHPPALQMPSIVNPPRKSTRSRRCNPRRSAAARITPRSTGSGSKYVAAPAYRTPRSSSTRNVMSSTGRNTVTPDAATNPWTLQGTPSTNGATRTRSQRVRKNSIADERASSLRTHRTYSAPPLKPSRASPAHTVPDPWSIRAHASSRARPSTGATIDGGRGTPAASNNVSPTVLSSSATHSGRRGPKTASGPNDWTAENGWASTSGTSPPTNSRIACSNSGGGSANR